MDVKKDIEGYASGLGAELKEKKGAWTMKLVIAERKAFLSKQKLEYVAKFRVDDSGRVLRFSEMLREKGSGVSGGDSDLSPGFGFKKESFKTGGGPREGTIEEQSNLFGKKYEYSFDFGAIRGWFEQLADELGYAFEYRVFSAGV